VDKADAVAVIGETRHLAQPQRRPQLRHGQPGAGLDRRPGARRRDPRLLPAGVEPSLGAGVPHRAEQPPGPDVRPGDGRGHHRQHLLRHPPPELRLRRQAVVLRQRAGGRVLRHQGVSTRPATRWWLQGWTVRVLDTNGNGRRDEYVEPGEPIDPTKDARGLSRRLLNFAGGWLPVPPIESYPTRPARRRPWWAPTCQER